MRLPLVAVLLFVALFSSGCVGGRANASNDAARADLVFGRSF